MELPANHCPKTPKCPLFQGKMLASNRAQEIYMRLYCTSGESGRMQCKRFLLVQEGIKPEPELMPDDSRSVEEIIKDMKS